MPTHLVDHPIVAERLTGLRNERTERADFRRNLHELSLFVLYEALHELPTTTIDIDTPLEPTTGVAITTPPLVIPVMRAGLGMLDAALLLLPEARVGFLGLKRNEETLLPEGADQIASQFLDVSGNNEVSALDALRVINIIARNNLPGGASESLQLQVADGNDDEDVWDEAIVDMASELF